eukprot:scaffold3907_cov48-Isochrysis_galbana.AAC.1
MQGRCRVEKGRRGQVWLTSESNRASASAFASSVFPTPVGPRKKREAVGLDGSLRPARER